MKRIALGFAAGVFSALYWWTVFVIVYADALFAGDRDPAAGGLSDRSVLAHHAVMIVAAIALQAMLAVLWRRATERWWQAARPD